MNQRIKESKNQRIKESKNQRIKESKNPRINESMNQWINGPMDQWTNGPMDQWTNESINQPIKPHLRSSLMYPDTADTTAQCAWTMSIKLFIIFSLVLDWPKDPFKGLEGVTVVYIINLYWKAPVLLLLVQ